jgi:predicted RND superfamily exporter protein
MIRGDQLVHGAAARPWLTLALLGIATALLCTGLRGLKVEADIDERELPRSDPDVTACLEIEDQFGETSPVTLVVELPDGESFYSARHLAAIRDLSARLEQAPELVPDDVISLTEVSDVSLGDGAVDSRRIVEFPLTRAKLARIRRQLRTNSLWAGRLVDGPGSTTLLTANTAVGSGPEQLYDRMLSITATAPAPLRVRATGGDLLPVAMTRSIDRDLQVFTPLAFLLVIVGFYLSFRRLAGVLVPVAVIAVSLLWLLGLMGLLGVALNPVTTVIPPTMVALGSSYGIHFMNRYYQVRRRGERGRDAVRGAGRMVARPLLMAGVTTAVGMATLVTFKIQMIRQFGVFMAVGLLMVVVLTLTLVPALLSLREVKAPRSGRRRGMLLPRLLGALSALCCRRPRAVLLAVGVVAALGLWLAAHTRVGIDLPSYFPKGHDQRAANDLISARLGGAAEATLRVTVDRRAYPEGTRSPELLEKLLRFEERVRRLPGVGHVQSLADVVHHVHRRVQEGLAAEQDTPLPARRRLAPENADGAEGRRAAPPRRRPSRADGAAQQNPRSKSHVDQLLLLYAMGAGMQAINRLEDPSHRHAAVKVAIRTWDQAEHRRVLAGIRAAFHDVLGSDTGRSAPARGGAAPTPVPRAPAGHSGEAGVPSARGARLTAGGDVVLMLAFDRYIVWGKLFNVALTLVLVFLCCAAVYRSLRHGLLSLIPVGFSTLVTFSLMGLLGIRLTMATAVITSIAIGVGVDFAIHFLDHVRRCQADSRMTADDAIARAMAGVGPAVIYDAGSNILGFLPLVLSSLVPVQHFGWLVSSCMLFSAVATLLILPAVLKVLADRRARRVATTSTSIVQKPTEATL